MNKKLLTIASICAFSSLTVLAEEATAEQAAPAPAATLMEAFADCPVVSNLSVELSLGFESQYIYRGLELAGGIVSPGLDLGYEVTENFGLYLGYWGAYSIDSAGCEENDIFLGATYAYDFVSFDAGYTAYTYTGHENDTNELKFVVTFDTSDLFAAGFDLAPYIGMFYDFDFEDQLVFETGISYSVPVSKLINGSEFASLDLGLAMGYASYCETSEYDDYFYLGMAADVVFTITEKSKFSIGLRYAYNNMDGEEEQNSNIWFGTKVSVGF